MTDVSISAVIPVYNEKGNVTRLHQELVTVFQANNYDFEIIFVDDGSTDGTSSVIAGLSPVKLIRMRKNFGQTAAMDAGIKAAQKAYIVTMDGDLQNNPADIPRLINHLENNDLDVVSGWRMNRKDSFGKRFASRGANFLRSILVKDAIHDSGCCLKVYKKECFRTISLYGEMHRFIPAILKIKGYAIGEIPVDHRPRASGCTKYNWRRTIKGFLDMIGVWFWNKYAVRPLHLLGGGGLLMLFFGFIAAVFTILEFFKGRSLSDSAWPLLTTFLSITGLLMLIAGLLADILTKIYFERTKDTPYSIKEIIENRLPEYDKSD